LSLLGTNEYEIFTNKKAPKEDVLGKLSKKQEQYDNINLSRQNLINKKGRLNELFFSLYSRFIQEGTWISEEYIDDDKYYHDASSVMYNSCYPKVAYQINIAELSQLAGYELMELDVGDKTFVVDPEFFGQELEIEIVTT
jgi:hypothetical protein